MSSQSWRKKVVLPVVSVGAVLGMTFGSVLPAHAATRTWETSGVAGVSAHGSSNFPVDGDSCRIYAYIKDTAADGYRAGVQVAGKDGNGPYREKSRLENTDGSGTTKYRVLTITNAAGTVDYYVREYIANGSYIHSTGSWKRVCY